MATSVLALVQMFTDKGGLPRPSALVTATDKSARQLLSLLRETIADLGEYKWQQQRIRTSFSSLAASLQGNLTTLFGAGYAGIVKNSLWNDTRHMRIFGPIADPLWQALQTLPAAGPQYQFWISRDALYISPNPVAGNTISAIYITKFNVLTHGTGTTYTEQIMNDDDTLVFPDNVVLRLFEAKWKKQKGEMDWQQTTLDAMALLMRSIIRDGSPVLQLDTPRTSGVRPGITIPPGSWGV